MLDVMHDNGTNVVAIGKIEDLFSGRGIDKAIHTNGNADGIEKTYYCIFQQVYCFLHLHTCLHLEPLLHRSRQVPL